MKIALFGLLIAAAAYVGSPAQAASKSESHDCCATAGSNSKAMACIDYASLGLTTDQKTKIEAWQAECTKAGCTKESRRTFLKRAKGILSDEQFAKLKQQCEGSAAHAKV